MIPVANKPIIAYNVEILLELEFDNIIIAASVFSDQIANYFRLNKNIKVVNVGKTQGPAFSLNAVKDYITVQSFLMLYGDTILEKSDLKALIQRYHLEGGISCTLISPLKEENSGDWICCSAEGGYIVDFMGHPRGGFPYRISAFAFSRDFFSYTLVNSGLFTNIEVGMMPRIEGYIEMSLADCAKDGNKLPAVVTEGFYIDIDKPWHILEANNYIIGKICGSLQENILKEGASIDPSSDIEGYASLGRGSRIGRNVKVSGNIVAGDNVLIENGVTIGGNVLIGDNTRISNYCYISGNSTIGRNCVVDHCAEFSGIAMDTVYLYHYMEVSGIIGMNTDIGAATVCGGLRFDDGRTMHVVNGRKELPFNYSNAVYLGDFCRTGVNVIIMPGCKTGVYCVIGAGVLVQEDVPDNTMLLLQQQIMKKEWGPNKYGW